MVLAIALSFLMSPAYAVSFQCELQTGPEAFFSPLLKVVGLDFAAEGYARKLQYVDEAFELYDESRKESYVVIEKEVVANGRIITVNKKNSNKKSEDVSCVPNNFSRCYTFKEGVGYIQKDMSNVSFVTFVAQGKELVVEVISNGAKTKQTLQTYLMHHTVDGLYKEYKCTSTGNVADVGESNKSNPTPELPSKYNPQGSGR